MRLTWTTLNTYPEMIPMPSFQISISPSRRVAARFITSVRRKILKALEEEQSKRGLRQTDVARAIGVHRSVINRELRGKKDLTLGRLAELAWAMGRAPLFDVLEIAIQSGSNLPISSNAAAGAFQPTPRTATTTVAIAPFAAANTNVPPVARIIAN